MRNALGIALSFFVVGCAHVDRQQALAATTYDVMTDAEVAAVAVSEALGELHEVTAIDAEGVVTEGHAAFASRTERLAYEQRVEALVRAHIYGQGPTLELMRLHCERLARAGWATWPADVRQRVDACEYGDVSMTVHSLFKKPMLQRAFVEVLLEVAADPLLTARAHRRLLALEKSGVEPYVLMVERWDQVEGFRPRG